MQDQEIVAEISRLMEEEHRIERGHVGAELSEDDQAHLAGVAVALDQCWDLLAQRRARRSAGKDPDEAQVRPASIVENFRQ